MVEPNRKPPGRRGKGRKQPITRHPLFPAIVALWFAVLSGLGSFVLRPALIEALVRASHFDLLVPAAAPPLGMTARLMLALLIGGLGGAIGWVLAKRSAGRKPRRAPKVLKVADVDLDEGLPWPATPAISRAGEPAKSRDHDTGPVLDRELPGDEVRPAPEPAEAAAVEAPRQTGAQRIAGAPIAELSHVELVERLAIALDRRRKHLEAMLAGKAEAHPLADTPASSPAAGPPDAVVRLRRLVDRQAVRFEPPSIAARAMPQETETALRDALAALERMSGAA